jgi:deoxyribonuclease-4
MTGKGSEMGGSFEELRAIMDRAAGLAEAGTGTGMSDGSGKVHDMRRKMGVCLDTCHVWDAGYDIVHDLDGVLTEFDRVVGLDRLHAIHLNNSKNPLGSRKDRHAKILEGEMPLDAIARIINHPALREVPFILETPNEDAGYAEEIRLLKSLVR